MLGSLEVVALFAITSAATIFLILRRPYLRVRILSRDIQVETYFLGALLGPLLILCLGILTAGQIVEGISGNATLNPFGILILFLSLVFLSIFLDITGFFEYSARMALKFAGNDGVRLFFAFYVLISLLTIVTSNDIIILTFTPFIYYFARDAGINPRPYLFAEFFAANTWSMMLYIGNPTNILIASAFHLRFGDYTGWMLLPTVIAGTVTALLLFLIFRREIKKPLPEYCGIDPQAAITDRAGAVLGLCLLFGCITALAIAPYAGIEMWMVSLAFALALLTILLLRDAHAIRLTTRGERIKPSLLPSTLHRMPWTVVPFLLSLFITVEALRVYGVSGEIGSYIADLGGSSSALYVLIYGIASALTSNVLNNIPMTVAFIPVMSGLTGENLTAAALATAVGSNLGANITPLGSLAGIMWMGILYGKEVRISFLEFMRIGAVVTLPALLFCLGALALEMMLV